jgi:hypothetical protein
LEDLTASLELIVNSAIKDSLCCAFIVWARKREMAKELNNLKLI